MSDDTKALVERLRESPNLTSPLPMLGVHLIPALSRDPRDSLRLQAADAIERLERDRDALAERCEKLREALRDATQIVEQYVARNPTWTSGIGKTQDPMGAHALLSRMLALAASKDAP